MTKHTITTQWDDVPDDADDLALIQGAFRRYACTCGTSLTDRSAAELHAVEANRCTACLGSAEEEVVPGFVRPCNSCAGTGRRGVQLMWQVAYGEAEKMITLELVRDVIAPLREPFHLSEVSDRVRALLGLEPGRLPVGPRVGELLRRLEADGELVMLSAPDQRLRGTSVVLYNDPAWQHTDPLTRLDAPPEERG
jgi:hypothetical protein